MTTTTDILALLSLLHESADDSSATRRFRNEPVLAWTLRRVRRADAIGGIAILCWDDQLPAIEPIAQSATATVITQGPRRRIPSIESIAAARRWADGWRGGPLGTSAFDAGYLATAVKAAAEQMNAGAIVLVDPSAALVDPSLINAIVVQHRSKPATEFTFTAAATGLGAMLLPRPLIDRLAAANSHPGRLLHYFPDQVSREPIAQDNCAPTPTPVARSIHRYTLTSRRQIDRIESATAELNGELNGSNAETIVARMARSTAFQPVTDALPREVVLELTTRRLSRPIFMPTAAHATTLTPVSERTREDPDSSREAIPESGSSRVRSDTGVRLQQLSDATTLTVERPDLPFNLARNLIDEMSALDDTRMTLAGIGDPLLHDDVIAIIEHAAARGIAVNVETDLLCADADLIARLADSPADVVSVHLPALSVATYAAVMGVEGYMTALANVQAFVARRAAAGRGTPLLVPLFTKCRQNLHEMEPWYDQWLRAVGSAVILGPTTFAGLIPDVGVADMSPPMRVPCRRLRERLTVLSDGRFTSCEQDVLGRQALGQVGVDSLPSIWQTKFAALRNTHTDGRWKELPACAKCREWNRA